MKNSKWNDTQLIELLQNMPHVKDSRNPQDIYQNISSKRIKKAKKLKGYAVLASLAAIFILAIIMPYFIYEQQSFNQSMSNSVTNSKSEMAILEDAAPKESRNMEINQLQKYSAQSFIQNHVVYEEQIKDDYLISIGVPIRDTENVVPISFLVPKNEVSSQTEAIQKVMQTFSEESIGLEDGEAFEMSGYGPIENEDITNRAKKGFFIYKYQDQILLVPYFEPFATFGQALKNMKEQNSTNLLPSIPKEFNIEKINKDGDQVMIAFTKNSKLTNSESDLIMLYAIMLTAREFGYNRITFNVPNVDHIGEIKMNTTNKVPIAPNLFQLY